MKLWQKFLVWTTIISFILFPVLMAPNVLAEDLKVSPIPGLTPGSTSVRNYTKQTNDTCSLNDRVLNITGDNNDATIEVPLPALAAAGIPTGQNVTVLKPVIQETGKVLFASDKPFWTDEIKVGSSFWKKVSSSIIGSFLKMESKIASISLLLPGHNKVAELTDVEAEELMNDLKERGNIIIEAYPGAELKDTFPTVPNTYLQVQYKITLQLDGKEVVTWGFGPSEDFIKNLNNTDWWKTSGSCRFLINPADFERILAAAGADINGDGKPDGAGLTGVDKGKTNNTNPPTYNDVSTNSNDQCSLGGLDKLPDFILNCIVRTFGIKFTQWVLQSALTLAGAPQEVINQLVPSNS